ncbi:hypothetical protein K0I63_03860 [Shewanella rhizosphaerae]|uniref:hypothetical protein n=1 Tax=Shewanella rhizosphaerae TaxID=2864207 RepID=UPI001C65B5A1|nr:hypothetical protein [Shewanella rhizosphaerae]QYK13662.1 hypothetical protein K0I63_03860 [Shewanella rhizosphaerae]
MTSNNTESDMNESKMAESKMQGLPTRLAELFEPYAGVSLSALDNFKLLKALADQAALNCECLELSGEPRAIYVANCDGHWFDCGFSNAYSAEIRPMTQPSEAQLATANKVEVPLLNAQQLSFMCMQYAHFDHC